jgi:GTP-binding protein
MVLFRDVRYLMSESDPHRVRPCKAEVAFVGRSNVGKSSLVNALLGRPLAKVSQTPGRTRTINVFQCAPERWLVDLPGYGFAVGPERERASWRGMIEGYLTGRASIRKIVVVIDAEVGPTAQDLQMTEWLGAQGLPYRAAATKTDKVKPSRHVPRRKEVAGLLGLAPGDLAWVSAAKGAGVRELRAALAQDLQRV